MNRNFLRWFYIGVQFVMLAVSMTWTITRFFSSLRRLCCDELKEGNSCFIGKMGALKLAA
jgi:hypothetical protein